MSSPYDAPAGSSGLPQVDPHQVGPAARQSAGATVRYSDISTIFVPLVRAWLNKIKVAADYKEEVFGKDAREAMQFFSGPYDFLYNANKSTGSKNYGFVTDDEDPPSTTYQMTLNKVAEAVQIFGPVLYQRNPNRTVSTRQQPEINTSLFLSLVSNLDPAAIQQDPMVAQAAEMVGQNQAIAKAIDEQRARLLEWYLNYTPTELNLYRECRRAIDEAVIKGMGVLWTELYQPGGVGPMLVGSFYDTVDNLVIDPDHETIETAKWIARRCTHPVWEVEKKYNVPTGTLKGMVESVNQGSIIVSGEAPAYQRSSESSSDLITYWKIWSKMGLGGRLSSSMTDEDRAYFDGVGDYCYLVIAENVPFPLNLNDQYINNYYGGDVNAALQWPTPYWAEDEWPFTPIYFHEVPRCPWPMGHFKPAIGELVMLNWLYSFVAGKIKNTCRDFVAIVKAASDEFKKAILHGKDLVMVELESTLGKSIGEIVQFLQHPPMNSDIWTIIQTITYNFEKRTGLTELIYGLTTKQMRSAKEAEIKAEQTQVRPDDMAAKVEMAMSEVARKEAFCARYHLRSPDIAPLMGPVAAALWDRLVATQDISVAGRQLEVRIEAGSTRRPDRNRESENAQNAVTMLLSLYWQFATQTGDFQPFNNLVAMWAKTQDIDPEILHIELPPPPPQSSPPQQPEPEPEGKPRE